MSSEKCLHMSVESSSNSILLHKNEFGNYEHDDTHFVFSKENKTVIGKQSPDGTIIPLSLSDLDLCKQMRVPLASSLLKNDGEDNKGEEDNAAEKIVVHHPQRSLPEQTLSDAEKKYKELIIELFISKWNKKFEGRTEITTHGLSNCKIRNIHGLEFYGYEIIYNPMVKEYVIEFYIGKSIDGITPRNGESELFMLQTSGPNLEKTFSSILDYINKYIFCKHCGVIRQYDSYSEKHNKCDNCLINDLLSMSRLHSEYCTICMEETKNYYSLRCGHKFHRACLSDLEIKSCPNCRKWINEEDGEDEGD